jgi:hypothetical protein
MPRVQSARQAEFLPILRQIEFDDHSHESPPRGAPLKSCDMLAFLSRRFHAWAGLKSGRRTDFDQVHREAAQTETKSVTAKQHGSVGIRGGKPYWVTRRKLRNLRRSVVITATIRSLITVLARTPIAHPSAIDDG